MEHEICQTCLDVGWIVVDQTWDWPYGEQVQCPDCFDDGGVSARVNGEVANDE